MGDGAQHSHISSLRQDLADGKIDRREFLRLVTLLGLSASSAYALLGAVTGERLVPRARAQMRRGGALRIGMAVQNVEAPHRYQWWEHNITRNVCEYLTRTDQMEASPEHAWQRGPSISPTRNDPWNEQIARVHFFGTLR